MDKILEITKTNGQKLKDSTEEQTVTGHVIML